ncbi:questin oxidase family protein [Streptomyces sp. NBC_01187]|uniref:questin oxidase family protein n=1 Tax=Streptomyces sp. NBC_01187 TaxID=2903766 RepID=UPI00386716B0|nr:questin oxidase family protein [Streptomyces sp. NBC_01187]
MDTEKNGVDPAGTGPDPDATGTLDEALERLHLSGPEREGWLSNHAPMAVEALVRHGHARAVHRWVDRYRTKLEDMPGQDLPVTGANWQEALGDPRRLGDWSGFFTLQMAERPWREVLAEWWPRLLPGISGAATHPVIRTGHAVRTLLSEGGETAPRRTELAHALGYWAARHSVLPGVTRLPAAASAEAGLAAVPLIDDQSGGIRDRLSRIGALPDRPAAPGGSVPAASGASGEATSTARNEAASCAGGEAAPERVRAALEEVVRASAHRYATHAHGSPVMLVHTATAPNAVLRVLPALPRPLWAAGADAAWAASTAVWAVYGPADGTPTASAAGHAPEEVFARAAAHGDEHAIKLADTVLDVAVRTPGGDPLALAASLRSVELIEPVF